MKTLNKLCLFIVCIAFTSCDEFWNHSIEGNGHVINISRSVPEFNEVEVNGNFYALIDTGAITSVNIETDENLIDYINTYVLGDKLIIESRHGENLQPSIEIYVHITSPLIKGMELNGSGNLLLSGLDSDNLDINLNGSGQITAHSIIVNQLIIDLAGSGYIRSDVISNNTKAKIEGSGEINLSGLSDTTGFTIEGSGNISAENLITDDCEASIFGSGIIETYVNNILDVTISGSGTVYYEGNPEVSTSISGSGRVVKR